MTNTELINAYLDNELSEGDRIQFEDRLNGDSELRQELSMQQDIIEGIRSVRKTELKQMLNNVPISQATTWTAGKIASIIAVVAVVAIGLVYVANNDEPTSTTEPTEAMRDNSSTDVTQAQDETTEIALTEEAPAEVETIEPVSPIVNNTENDDEPEVARQPEVKRPVVAPDFDRNDKDRTDIVSPDGTILGEFVDSPTQTDVEIDRLNSAYTFHYAFEPGMLKLYGDFDNELYQILEFNSADGRNWFLEYEGIYYYLDNSSTEIQPLREIKDENLLNILKRSE